MFDQQLIKLISQIANDHEIAPAALLAIVEVESGGKLGAMVNGKKEPLIRFEGHYFYRLLPAQKRNLAVTRGLASSRAGAVRNTFSQSGRWKLLKRAEAIDRPAALASCSWGCGQVMGSHWRWLGYASIDALVADARSGADGQVRLMMRYIKKAGLVGKLQTYDWAGFARAYNGPAYRKYKYDTKMRAAYRRHVSKLGQSSTESVRPARNGMALLRFGSRGDGVRDLQRNLRSLGFHLEIDGDFGPATERMLKAFQRENRLKPDGIFGPKSLEMIVRKLPRLK